MFRGKMNGKWRRRRQGVKVFRRLSGTAGRCRGSVPKGKAHGSDLWDAASRKCLTASCFRKPPGYASQTVHLRAVNRPFENRKPPGCRPPPLQLPETSWPFGMQNPRLYVRKYLWFCRKKHCPAAGNIRDCIGKAPAFLAEKTGWRNISAVKILINGNFGLPLHPQNTRWRDSSAG